MRYDIYIYMSLGAKGLKDFYIIRTVHIVKSVPPPTNVLNKIQFIIIMRTSTCFSIGVSSSGSYRMKDYKPNTARIEVLKMLTF